MIPALIVSSQKASVQSVNVSAPLILHTAVRLIEVVASTATTELLVNFCLSAVERAIYVDQAQAAPLIAATKLSTDVAALTQISTEPAPDGVALKVKVTHLITTVSHSVGVVAIARETEDGRL
jgi:hypothetical protein